MVRSGGKAGLLVFFRTQGGGDWPLIEEADGADCAGSQEPVGSRDSQSCIIIASRWMLLDVLRRLRPGISTYVLILLTYVREVNLVWSQALEAKKGSDAFVG